MLPASIAKLARERPQLGLAVAGGFGGLVPIDFDTDDPAVYRAIAAVLPRPNVGKKGRRGFVGFWRTADGEDLPKSRDFMTPGLDRHGKPSKKPLVSILTKRKTVLPPSIHPDTGEPYRWLTRATLYTRPVLNLVPITAANIDALAVALRPWCPLPQPMRPSILQPNELVGDKRMRSYALSALRNEAKRLAGMSEESGRNTRLFSAGCVLGKFVHHKVLVLGEVEDAMLRACRDNKLPGGDQQCLATLAQGIKRAVNDALPALGYWGRG
jgi:hypothetical protein